jgi:hypothetical protein
MVPYDFPMSYTDATESATALDAYADLLQAGDGVWDDLGHQLGTSRPADALVSLDGAAVSIQKLDWPKGVVQAVGMMAAQYVAAIAQYTRGLEALVRSRQVILPPWPVVRGQLELAGRVGWLLEPESAGGERVPPQVRVARYHMEALASLCRRRYSLGVMNAKKSVVNLVKAKRDEVRDQTEILFDDAFLDWSEPGDEGKWKVGGETYVGLGGGIKRFTHVTMLGARGMYDTLSDYSHPSPLILTSLSAEYEHDGHRTFDWEIDTDQFVWIVHGSAAILYGAARLVAGYHRLDDTQLEAWYSQVQARVQAEGEPIGLAAGGAEGGASDDGRG